MIREMRVSARHVRIYKTFPVWVRSWITFVLALALMGAVWYFCYWLVGEYAGSKIIYFKTGALVAVIFGGIMLVFNEPIVALSMGGKRIKKRNQCPKLWDAVHFIR